MRITHFFYIYNNYKNIKKPFNVYFRLIRFKGILFFCEHNLIVHSMNRWINVLNPQNEYGCWIVVLTAELAWNDQLTPIAYNCLNEDSCYFVRLPCNTYACKLCTVPIRTVSDTSYDGYRKLHKHQSILRKIISKRKRKMGEVHI